MPNFDLSFICDLNSASERYKKEFLNNGFLKIDNFLSKKNCKELLEDLVLEKMHRNRYFNNIYSVPCRVNPIMPYFNEQVETSSSVLSGNNLTGSQLYRLASARGFINFLQDIVGMELFSFNEPQGFVTIALMEEKDFVEWHFDQHDVVCIVALMLPEEGGELLVAPNIKEDVMLSKLRLKNLLEHVSNCSLNAQIRVGDLILIKGNQTMHRVNRVQRGKRMTILLSYSSIENFKGDKKQRHLRFGN